MSGIAHLVVDASVDTNDPARIAGRIFGVVLVIGVITFGIVKLIQSGGRKTGPPRPRVQFTSDGRFWWDGMRWIDADVTHPPGVPFTPDGLLWWDGVRWRPRGPSLGPPPP